MPDQPTDQEQWNYSDLSAVLRRVEARGTQTVDSPFMPIHLDGSSPVIGDGEYEVARFGGGMEIHGTFKADDDAEDTLSMGLIAHAAAELVLTSERLICSLGHGETRAGAVSQRKHVVVLDFPWGLVELVETPVKASVADRISGGKPIRIAAFTYGVARFSFTVASAMSEPPGSEPVRKVKNDEALKAIIGAAARWRMQRATPEEAARLTRVLAGESVTEDGDLIAYLVDPNANDDSEAPTQVGGAVDRSPSASMPTPPLDPVDTPTQERPPVFPRTTEAPASPSRVWLGKEEPTAPTQAQPRVWLGKEEPLAPTPQRAAADHEPYRPVPPPPPLPPSGERGSRVPRMVALAVAAVLLVGVGAGGAVLATRDSDRSGSGAILSDASSGDGATDGSYTDEGSSSDEGSSDSGGDVEDYGESSEPYDAEDPSDLGGSPDVDSATDDDSTDDSTDYATEDDSSTDSADGPSGVLRQHFDLLASGDYDAAFALMADSYQRKAARWPALRSQADPGVSVESIGPVSMGSGEASVEVKFYARDRNRVNNSDTKCRRFTGTAHMIHRSGEWRYDPLRNQYDVLELPASNSKCP